MLLDDALTFARTSFASNRSEQVDLAEIVRHECSERTASDQAIKCDVPATPIHDRGVFLHRKTLVGDGLHELLVGLVDESPFVGVAGRRLNLLCVVLLYVGNFVERRRCRVEFLIGDGLRRLRGRRSRRLYLSISRGNRSGEDYSCQNMEFHLHSPIFPPSLGPGRAR